LKISDFEHVEYTEDINQSYHLNCDDAHPLYIFSLQADNDVRCYDVFTLLQIDYKELPDLSLEQFKTKCNDFASRMDKNFKYLYLLNNETDRQTFRKDNAPLFCLYDLLPKIQTVGYMCKAIYCLIHLIVARVGVDNAGPYYK
jgi:hypothetical protein